MCYIGGMVRTNFYFPESLLERLRRVKGITGAPVSALIRKAVEQYLDEIDASLAISPEAGVRVNCKENKSDE